MNDSWPLRSLGFLSSSNIVFWRGKEVQFMIFLPPSENSPKAESIQQSRWKSWALLSWLETGPNPAKDPAAGSLLAVTKLSYFQWAASTRISPDHSSPVSTTVCTGTICCCVHRMPTKTMFRFLRGCTSSPWMWKQIREQRDSGIGCLIPTQYQASSIHLEDAQGSWHSVPWKEYEYFNGLDFILSIPTGIIIFPFMLTSLSALSVSILLKRGKCLCFKETLHQSLWVFSFQGIDVLYGYPNGFLLCHLLNPASQQLQTQLSQLADQCSLL